MLAAALVEPYRLPGTLTDPKARAEFVEKVDKVVFQRIIDMKSTQLWSSMEHNELYDQLFKQFGETFAGYTEFESAPRTLNPDIVVNMILRLWSGGISGMKAVATETNDGPTCPCSRARQLASIWLDCIWDPVVFAGVRVGHLMRDIRGQAWTLKGAPEEWKKCFLEDSPALPTMDYSQQARRAARLSQWEHDIRQEAIDKAVGRAIAAADAMIHLPGDNAALEGFPESLPEDTPEIYAKSKIEKSLMGRHHDPPKEATDGIQSAPAGPDLSTD